MAKVTEKSEVSKAISAYCLQKGISRNELAVQIGVSGATLSNMVNNKWERIDDGMWQRVWNHVRPLETPSLISTSDFAAMDRLCATAKERHLMAGLIGDTGTGKTVALEVLSRRENVFYLYYNSNMRPKHFFYELGRLLGYDYDGNMYDMVNRACDTLNGMADPLIIIDEASKLTDQMLLALHVLRDKTMRNCGIVLAGMPYFRTNLIKKAQKQKVGISEFLRRIQLWHELRGLTNEDIRAVCEVNGITDKKQVAGFRSFRRIGDLSNEILLYNTLNR